MKLILVYLFFITSFIILASAFSTVEINAPADVTYFEVVTVNVSAAMNVTAFPFLTSSPGGDSGFNITSHIINVTILNHSGSATDDYGILASSLSLTYNASNYSTIVDFWNFTGTFTNERNWIRVNFTNVSRAADGSFGGALTSERIVQIDTAGNVLNLGGFDTHNFSFDSGDFNISRLFLGAGIDLNTDVAESGETCTAANRGLIIYNSTDGFMGCTESGWYSLNSTN